MPSAWYQPTSAQRESRKAQTAPIILKELLLSSQTEKPCAGPKICIPGRAVSPDKEETGQIAKKPPTVYCLPEKQRRPDDSLSRHVSLQTCISLFMLALTLLLRTVSEPLFSLVQQEAREALSDLSAVAAVSAVLRQTEEKGIEESLRQVLTYGMEEDDSASVHSASISAMGGAPNQPVETASSDEAVQTAAGGKYPVSMEQMPFAVCAMSGDILQAVCPVNGILTCGYGPREHPITGKADFHTGIDLAAAEGTPILAAADGVVAECGTDSSLGNYVILRHNTQLMTTYSHCQSVLVSEGDTVECGEMIALVGSTGVSTGPHLHFECISNGTLTDPAWILEMKP